MDVVVRNHEKSVGKILVVIAVFKSQEVLTQNVKYLI